MADFIIQHGDTALFLPAFGPAVVTPMPGVISGSGARCPVTQRPICLEGDEKSVRVPGCAYVSGAYVVPGIGTLKILSLAPNQRALRTRSGGRAVVLKGEQFEAIFEVMTPAQMPPIVSTPDPVPIYMGKGLFVTTNLRVRGT